MYFKLLPLSLFFSFVISSRENILKGFPSSENNWLKGAKCWIIPCCSSDATPVLPARLCLLDVPTEASDCRVYGHVIAAAKLTKPSVQYWSGWEFIRWVMTFLLFYGIFLLWPIFFQNPFYSTRGIFKMSVLPEIWVGYLFVTNPFYSSHPLMQQSY